MKLSLKTISLHCLALLTGLILALPMANTTSYANTLDNISDSAKNAFKGEFDSIRNRFEGEVDGTADDIENEFFDTAQSFFDDLGLGSFGRRFLGGLSGKGYCGQQTRVGIGAMICGMVNHSSGLPFFVVAIAYLLGLFFAIKALYMLKASVEQPAQNPISQPIKHFIAGGMFFSLPAVTSALQETLGGGEKGITPYNYRGQGLYADVNGKGIDASLVNFVADLWQPLQIAIGAFGYLAGLVLTVVAISRLVKTAQDGPKGPASFGTIMTFITAGALFSLDSLMGAFSKSIFGSHVIKTYPALSARMKTGDDMVNAQIEGVLTSIVAFVALVGWISFVRGFFIMRDVAEGNQQASLMAASTHLIAGAIAVNLGPFMMAIQSTFGISGYGLLFS